MHGAQHADGARSGLSVTQAALCRRQLEQPPAGRRRRITAAAEHRKDGPHLNGVSQRGACSKGGTADGFYSDMLTFASQAASTNSRRLNLPKEGKSIA